MLAVPDGLHNVSTVEAAVTYAYHGWYVLPVVRGKHAGSYLGRGWPDKSTRDPDLIRAWFTSSPDIGIALHVGRSGAIAFDVDEPDHLPIALVRELIDTPPPYQMTRPDHPGRGHFLYALPDGVMFGNSLGQLRTDPPWGDVRGRNGIILAEPSQHASPRGRYCWHTTGTLPTLRRHLGRLLHKPPPPPPEHVGKAPHLFQAAALNGIFDKLRTAEVGNRNNMLFWAACCVGEMSTRHRIDVDGITNHLVNLATDLGLKPNEATATVASGIRTGAWVAK